MGHREKGQGGGLAREGGSAWLRIVRGGRHFKLLISGYNLAQMGAPWRGR